MKIIDEREMQKKNKDRREQGGKSYSERVRAKLFCGAFKLRFLQLICKTSLTFKLNLESALSIILKKESYSSQSMLWWSADV